jgi:hypothetical protein
MKFKKKMTWKFRGTPNSCFTIILWIELVRFIGFSNYIQLLGSMQS